MVPKFRGNSDDWLDSDDSSNRRGGPGGKKKAAPKGTAELSREESNAIVAEVFPNLCRVKLDQDQSDLLCSYRRNVVTGKSTEKFRERTPVAVGDRVLARRTEDARGVIEGICPRENCLSRPAPGRETENLQQIIAANVDVVVIVASCKEPYFSPSLVDRFLVRSELEGITALICVTKIDLLSSENKTWDLYRSLGYQVLEISSKKGMQMDLVTKEIEGKTVVFCGESGVGKTSLLRALLGSEVGRIGAVNELTGKGRHTTTGAVLLGGPHGSKWIDTPGVREFGIPKVSAKTLAACFPEFRNLPCPQSGCLHLDEAGCLAHALARYSSYRSLIDSLLLSK